MKTIFSDHVRSKKLIIAAAISAFTAGLVSSSHHWYGAIVYDTTWRLEVSYWIPVLVLIIITLLYIYWKCVGNIVGKIALWIFSFRRSFFPNRIHAL